MREMTTWQIVVAIVLIYVGLIWCIADGMDLERYDNEEGR